MHYVWEKVKVVQWDSGVEVELGIRSFPAASLPMCFCTIALGCPLPRDCLVLAELCTGADTMPNHVQNELW